MLRELGARSCSFLLAILRILTLTLKGKGKHYTVSSRTVVLKIYRDSAKQ